ncbi:hypothetical protein H072_11455 [Dactylellina haptotyla CBS 200.50]|uniref:Uncharacterized protein n=1 Tax=Dactylellina haptotyla (strain CBS 200.50) TaxID=1284197 RepID=S7ZXK6_DACHA|nr:hypothetical protein H072_11455 [Dactylellina haptotyla CBS 200.50]
MRGFSIIATAAIALFSTSSLAVVIPQAREAEPVEEIKRAETILHEPRAVFVFTSVKIAAEFTTWTTKTGDLTDKLLPLVDRTARATVITAFRAVTGGLNELLISVDGFSSQAAGATVTFTGAEARTISAAFKAYIEAQTALITAVTARRNLAAAYFGLPAVVEILTAVEAFTDKLAFSIIHLIPSLRSDIQIISSDFNVVVKGAISAYSVTCITLLFPTVQPICLNIRI